MWKPHREHTVSSSDKLADPANGILCMGVMALVTPCGAPAWWCARVMCPAIGPCWNTSSLTHSSEDSAFHPTRGQGRGVHAVAGVLWMPSSHPPAENVVEEKVLVDVAICSSCMFSAFSFIPREHTHITQVGGRSVKSLTRPHEQVLSTDPERFSQYSNRRQCLFFRIYRIGIYGRILLLCRDLLYVTKMLCCVT